LHYEDILSLALYVEHQVSARGNLSSYPRPEGASRSVSTREDRLDLSIALIKFFDTGEREGSLLFAEEIDGIIDAWDFLVPALDLLEEVQAWIDDRQYKDAHLAELFQFNGRFFELRPEIDRDLPSNIHRV